MIDRYSILKEILRFKKELAIARHQFDVVVDPLLIDHAVFRIGAAEKQLEHLFRLARQSGISFDGVQWDWAENE